MSVRSLRVFFLVLSSVTLAACGSADNIDQGYVVDANVDDGGMTTDGGTVHAGVTSQFGTATNDRAISVAASSDGSVLVAGITAGDLGGTGYAGVWDVFVRKHDAAGNLLWMRQFGTQTDDYVGSVGVGSDGSVLVAGYTRGDLGGMGNAGDVDAYVRKYDPAGNLMWMRQFGTPSFDSAAAVSVGSDGSVLVAGYTAGNLGGTGNAGSGDAYLRKYDAAGTVLWTRQFGTENDDLAASVSLDSDGSVLVAGYTVGNFGGTGNAGGRDAYVRKYDAAGNVLWTRLFGTTSSDDASSVSVGSGGSVVVAGNTEGDLGGTGSAGAVDAYVRLYDADGNLLWIRQFGTEADDYAHSVSVGIDASLVVAGYTEGDLGGTGNGGGFDAFVRRYDAAGAVLWTRQVGTPSAEEANSVSVGGDGRVLIAGYTGGDLGGTGNAGGFDAFVMALAVP